MTRARLPGFDAEATLYDSRISYWSSTARGYASSVLPAAYVDQACLGRCKQNCSIACAGTTGSGKAGCIHECARENAGCTSICTRPGDPPTSPSTPPARCSISDTRRCLLFGFIPVPVGTPFATCTGSCTKTCCTTSDDQRLCGVSAC
jgi:hypothetical protein